MTETTRRMRIGELATATGHSAHTLRYYESAGLLPAVERDSANHRRYRPEHIRWVGLLGRLRASGMSIRRARRYVSLALRGDATIAERASLLRAHARDIDRRIATLRTSAAIVQAKIDLYEGRSSDIERVWAMVEDACVTPPARSAPGPENLDGDSDESAAAVTVSPAAR